MIGEPIFKKIAEEFCRTRELANIITSYLSPFSNRESMD